MNIPFPRLAAFLLLPLLLATATSPASSQSWQRVGLQSDDVASLARGADGTLYAGGSRWLHRSTDGGATWEQLHRINASRRLAVEGDLIAVIGQAAFSLSSDRGATWSALRDTQLRDSLGSLGSVLIADGTIYLGTVTDLFRSTDSGATWHSRAEGLPEQYPHIGTLATMPDGRLLGGSQGIFGGNIYMSDDDVTSWMPVFIRRQPSEDEPNAVASTRAGTILAGIFRTGIMRSTDEGGSWQETDFASFDRETIVDFHTAGGTIHAVVSDGRLLVSTNDGVNWTQTTNTGLPNGGALSLLPMEEGRLLAGTGDGIYQIVFPSAVDGESTTVEMTLTPTPSADGAITLRRSAAATPARWSVVDGLGRVLQSGELAAGAATLRVEGLPGGHHLLRVADGAHVRVLPVVVAR